MSEPKINALVSALGTSENETVRAYTVHAFTGSLPTCPVCNTTKTFEDGYHFRGDKNVPDHVLSCACGVEKVHESKPRRSTAMAWNVPPTVEVLKHKSVIGLWDDALSIPESCLQVHQECDYDHDWHGKKSALALPQVLSYAYTFDVPVTVTVDDTKYADISALYNTNWDGSGFLLDPEWYTVRKNSQVISGLIELSKESGLSTEDRHSLDTVIGGMTGNASPLTRKNIGTA